MKTLKSIAITLVLLGVVAVLAKTGLEIKTAEVQAQAEIKSETETANQNPIANFYPETFVVVEAVHTKDWTGYMIVMRYSDYIRKVEGKTSYEITHRIDEDPEDIAVGDVIGCIMSDRGTGEIYDDAIIEWKYAGWIPETNK